jgi:ankyrin repeat protein
MPNTPLYMAVRNKHVKATKLLLMYGATPSRLFNDGITYLQYAVCSNNIDLIEALLYGNLDIDEESGTGRTALHMATVAGHIDVIRCC